ncbi:DUF3600 domain-containing protein [Paenibacillus daejeonensis]|uniref:DUF3600 domain-containing protein n=1 Tax=Paenibacillus daejeonensis TaxID=135193 RepID=UPI00036DB265|nr:DUF3600 domain-containing protein [Paenibacillus daejeonensis]
MKFEDRLRKAYREESAGVTPPPEMKDSLMDQIKGRGGRMKGRKWLMVTIIAAAVILPTGAYAGYTYLADSIYGSKQQLIEMGGTAEGYERLEAKLQESRDHFTEEEFDAFLAVLQQVGQFATLHADSQGNLNPENWSADIQEQYAAYLEQLEPFVTQLEASQNSDVPPDLDDRNAHWEAQLAKAEELLTAEDYERFTLLYDQIRVYQDMLTRNEPLTDEQFEDVKGLREATEPYLNKLGLSWSLGAS